MGIGTEPKKKEDSKPQAMDTFTFEYGHLGGMASW